MIADVPLGLFLTHNLRRALWLGPLVLAIGALCLTSGGGFPVLVLGRLLMGLGQALSMMGGLTAILRFQSGRSLASALNAYELSAMIGMLGGVIAIAALRRAFRGTPRSCSLRAPAHRHRVIRSWWRRCPRRRERARSRSSRGRRRAARRPTRARITRIGSSTCRWYRSPSRPGGLIALAYSTMEQFLVPLRASREFGLERTGVARLLMVQQLFDIVALLTIGILADRRGAARVLPVVLLTMATANALVGFGALPVVVVRCALFGLRCGLDAAAQRAAAETPPEHVAWRNRALPRLRGRRDIPSAPSSPAPWACTSPGSCPPSGPPRWRSQACSSGARPPYCRGYPGLALVARLLAARNNGAARMCGRRRDARRRAGLPGTGPLRFSECWAVQRGERGQPCRAMVPERRARARRSTPVNASARSRGRAGTRRSACPGRRRGRGRGISRRPRRRGRARSATRRARRGLPPQHAERQHPARHRETEERAPDDDDGSAPKPRSAFASPS